MLAAIVTATALSVSPSPYDLLAAHADVTAPPGTPALTSPSPRMRLAMLLALVAADALDRDAPDHFRWFAPDLSWELEIGHARRVVERVRECPPLADDWLPPSSWFRAEADAYGVCSQAWSDRAAEYRARVEWENDREEGLYAWARHMDDRASRYAELGYRFSGWGGQSWQRPRRVVLGEVREWIGSEAWERRAWPVSE